jgi:hypothetical protein
LRWLWDDLQRRSQVHQRQLHLRHRSNVLQQRLRQHHDQRHELRQLRPCLRHGSDLLEQHLPVLH